MTSQPPMSRQRRWQIAGVAATVIVGAILWLRSGERSSLPTVTVQRGTVREHLLQLGELVPREAVPVIIPFNSRLQFIVTDGSWIEAGAEVLALSEEDAVREAAELRAQLLAARQDLRLARLKRRQTVAAQDAAVAQARRALTLEQLRQRIANEPAEGGDALIRLDAELAPIEAVSLRIRDEADAAQAAWQRAQDAWLTAVDGRAALRDTILRLDARIAELEPAAARDDVGMQSEDQAAKAKAASELATVRQEREVAQASLPTSEAALVAAQTARAASAPERERTAVALAAAEASEAELRTRIEIEKRALPVTRLQLDVATAELAQRQAAERLERARAAHAAGAFSLAQVEDADEAARRAVADLDVVRARLAIAARPPTSEEAAEAAARLDRVQSRANAAEADRTRALDLADRDIAVQEAKVARFKHDIDARAANFAEVIEATLTFVQQELASLDADDADDALRRGEAEAELATLTTQLAAAQATPPNVLRSPVSGVIRLAREGDRPKQVGDQVWEADICAEILPPGRLDVRMQVNEVEVARVTPGQLASVTVPAVPGFSAAGTVVRISALGRDKFEGQWPLAGVVRFEALVELGAEVEGLRQGTTALVDLTLGERASVLWLPLAAVTANGTSWQVQRVDGTMQAVQGEAYGDDAFIITDGLMAGDGVRLGAAP